MWFQEEKSLQKQDVINQAIRFAETAREQICKNPKRVLLLPPDITRAHSGAGYITEELYKIFAKDADVVLIPTLGQHVPHTPEQNKWMFGSVPEEKIYKHNWRTDSKKIGEIPADFVKEISNGKADWTIPVTLNKRLFDENWDLILNIGHVVPHEVLGFANHNKNYFIGLGGKEMICASHLMAACCGIENNLGVLTTPLRACYNKAESEFLSNLPDAYFQVVMAYNPTGELIHTGIYAGNDVETYLSAARASQKQNITIVPPLKKVVAVMQGDEFYSTWVANKAIYRTRKAMADGGELLIIAPGLKRFGEQTEIDNLIRKYGYIGTEQVMKLYRECPENGDLKDLAVGTAHLIHGSSEGRFKITYAPGYISKEDMNLVNFEYADYNETIKRYDLNKLKNGFNTLPDGEEIYFISTPSAGLWSTAERLK
ncbi:MAG: lactate racemase domain-containing protein [Planctomycetaceae bacterium]|jgi:nickel-dependent lactate racemase|nr:lactate racemase domain-containing protein [Planctomycetaceae bacterium]